MAEERKIVLKADHVVKQFGGLRAIDDASMHLYENEILALIGPNGAGKTTMFNMISGALPLTSGSITMFDHEYKKPVAHKMAHAGLGRTYQVVKPFGAMTALENTMVGAFLHHRKTKDAIDLSMSILEKLELGHKANVRGASLSLIDLKRLEVARALATEPKILLLDEVMAGLNPTESEVVLQMIFDIRDSGISIILIEHVMRAVMKLSDRIYVLAQGKMIAEGNPEQISTNEQVIESYLGRHYKNASNA